MTFFLDDVIGELKNTLRKSNSYLKPVLQVVLFDQRKRFSDFYRIKVYEKERGYKCEYIWVKILKNKSPEIIQAALRRQYDLMTDLFYGLKENKYSSVELSCCEPIGVFLEHGAIATKECRGIYFDKYLKFHIPIFSAENILNHCLQLGKLLKSTHLHYLSSAYLRTKSIAKYIARYKHKIGTYPDKSLEYLTICHNDFSPRNLFVSNKCVELIDFVGLKPGFPQEDLFFFSRYILKAKFNYLYTNSFKENMIRKFLKGYGVSDFNIIFNFL